MLFCAFYFMFSWFVYRLGLALAPELLLLLLLLRVDRACVQLTRLTVLLPMLTSMDWIQLVAVVVAAAAAELSIIIRTTMNNKSLV
jgi:hypothetical protein